MPEEFEISRAKQAAVELWGENEETWQMETADVYQKLARGIVEANVNITAVPAKGVVSKVIRVAKNRALPYLSKAAESANERTWMTQYGTAYEMGYVAQLEDGTASNPDHRYRRLNDMVQIYKEVVPPPPAAESQEV